MQERPCLGSSTLRQGAGQGNPLIIGKNGTIIEPWDQPAAKGLFTRGRLYDQAAVPIKHVTQLSASDRPVPGQAQPFQLCLTTAPPCAATLPQPSSKPFLISRRSTARSHTSHHRKEARVALRTSVSSCATLALWDYARRGSARAACWPAHPFTCKPGDPRQGTEEIKCCRQAPGRPSPYTWDTSQTLRCVRGPGLQVRSVVLPRAHTPRGLLGDSRNPALCLSPLAANADCCLQPCPNTHQGIGRETAALCCHQHWRQTAGPSCSWPRRPSLCARGCRHTGSMRNCEHR